MAAKELDTMVNAMRTKHHQVNTRAELTDAIFYLYKGLKAIEKNDLVDELVALYTEIDGIDTNEIIKMKTFTLKIERKCNEQI